jgi:large exoprotein involved in heme utilization and adhesion
LITSTESGASGSGGGITVNTNDLQVQNGAVVNAQTLSSEKGGSVNIKANTFEASGGGQVLASSSSSGNAGNITLNVIDSVSLSGNDPTYADRLTKFAVKVVPQDLGGKVVANQSAASGLLANTTPGSTGAGGSIFIDPNQLKLTDGASVVVDSLGSGRGGKLSIHTGSLTLDNGSSLLARSNSAFGGNIDLTVPSLLLMRHKSNISANAGIAGGGGNGGNITINTPFLVAVPSENSDITANATAGNGGNVIINNNFGVYGIQSRATQTLESDITATGEVKNGNIIINTVQVDPSRGLVTLPVVPVNLTGIIAQGCPANVGSRASKFVITGRGGLPPNPSQPLGDDAVLTNWATLNPRVEHRPTSADSIKPTSAAPTPIVPATGWVFNGKGEVALIASAPTVTPDIPWLTPTTCHPQ